MTALIWSAAAAAGRRWCRRQLTLIFSLQFVRNFSGHLFSVTPSYMSTCLHTVHVEHCFWALSLRHLTALLCAHLWRANCVTRHECDELTGDELTVWRLDCVTSWLVADDFMLRFCLLIYFWIIFRTSNSSSTWNSSSKLEGKFD